MRYFFLILFFLMFPFSLFCELRYFSSNGLGMKIEEISEYRDEEFDWLLKEEILSEKIIRSLSYKGDLRKKWIVYYNQNKKTREEHFENDLLQWQKEFDTQGRLRREDLFKNGEPWEIHKINYLKDSHRIHRVYVYSVEQVLLRTKRYLYNRAGKLIRIQVIEGEKEELASWRYSDGVIYQLSHKKNDNEIVSFLNRNGELKALEKWKKDKIVEEEQYTYENGKLRAASYKDEDEKLLLDFFNEAEQLLRREVYDEKELLSVTEWVWEDDKIIEKRLRRDDTLYVWKNSYSASGELSKQEYYRDRQLQKIYNFTDKDNYTIDIYFEEELLVRVYYKNDVKIKEEFFEDGEIVRTRDLVEDGE